MAKPRRLANGHWQVSVENARRNIARTKRTFATRQEALAWQKAVLDDGFTRLLGGKPARTFGQALARYLAEHTPTKKNPRHDHSHADALRWPYWDADARRFVLLEDVALADLPVHLAAWTADQRRVQQRCYLHGRLYQLWRTDTGAPVWTEQPRPGPDGRPRARTAVPDSTAQAIQAALAGRPGRGGFDSGTLRHRQILAKHILKLAWRSWGWLDQDLAARVELAKPARAREVFLSRAEVDALIAAARQRNPDGHHFADLLDAYTLIGWRRSNIVYLRWESVAGFQADRMPGPDDPPAWFWTDRQHTKNGDPLAHPIGPRVHALFARRWASQNGPFVFHDGQGNPWGNYRKRLATALRGAGLGHIRTHDLRHTWASLAVQDDKPDRHIQELGGWRDAKMLQRYAHLRLSHLLPSAN